MNEQHVKGAVEKLTGNMKMQAEGKLDNAKGSVRDAAGDVASESSDKASDGTS